MCLISTYIRFMAIFAKILYTNQVDTQYEKEVIDAPDRQMQGYGAY